MVRSLNYFCLFAAKGFCKAPTFQSLKTLQVKLFDFVSRPSTGKVQVLLIKTAIKQIELVCFVVGSKL